MVDIIKPILYPPTETDFESAGLGVLSDSVNCVVTEERNGIFELEMEYPTSGIHFDEILDACLVYAKPSPYRVPEAFRVYKISTPLNGIVTINARHITYDLNGIPVTPFSASNVVEAMASIKSHMAIDNDFDFWTNKTDSGDFRVELPTGTRSILGGQDGSVLDVYGGEYAWQGMQVRLYNQRGQDNGVVIRYGKNLTDINQERNLSNVLTGIYPYWSNGDGDLVTSDPPIVSAPGTYPVPKIATVDFSNEFEEKPTADQLKQRAENYISSNQIGIPEVSIKVSFVQLEQTEEYKNIRLLEKCDLCDTVTVQFSALKVDSKAKIVKTVYDVLLDRYNSVEIGSIRTNIADTIANQQAEIKKGPNSSFIQSIANDITNTIIGANGGNVRLLDTNNDGEPDTLYIADNPDPALAQKVWRFNYEGWGASTNGYNGPFSVAATLDQGLYGDFITAGTINAALVNVINLTASSIVAGILKSKDGSSYWNLDTGDLSLQGTLSSRTGPAMAQLNAGGARLLYNNNVVGELASSFDTATGSAGVALDVADGGKFLSFGTKNTSSGTGNIKMAYTPTAGPAGSERSDCITFGCKVDGFNNNFYNIDLYGTGANGYKSYDGTFQYIYKIENIGNGNIRWSWAYMTVRDGIITSSGQ